MTLPGSLRMPPVGLFLVGRDAPARLPALGQIRRGRRRPGLIETVPARAGVLKQRQRLVPLHGTGATERKESRQTFRSGGGLLGHRLFVPPAGRRPVGGLQCPHFERETEIRRTGTDGCRGAHGLQQVATAHQPAGRQLSGVGIQHGQVIRQLAGDAGGRADLVALRETCVGELEQGEGVASLRFVGR